MPIEAILPFIGPTILAAVTGFWFTPVYEYAAQFIRRHAVCDTTSENKAEAIEILSAMGGSIAAGASLLIPLYVFGFLPLCDHTQPFFWFWSLGAILYRIYQWQKEKVAENERKTLLDESIRIEIEERHRENEASQQ